MLGLFSQLFLITDIINLALMPKGLRWTAVKDKLTWHVIILQESTFQESCKTLILLVPAFNALLYAKDPVIFCGYTPNIAVDIVSV
jgi:hypothetical protein